MFSEIKSSRVYFVLYFVRRECHLIYGHTHEAYIYIYIYIYNVFIHSWSGITEADMKGITKTFTEMQDDLLALFNDKTVLVGHCISSDLTVLKVIHIMMD